jgi:hypothetical protein
MSKLVRNNTRLVSGNTILQTLNASVRSLAKIICSPEAYGSLPISILILRMQKITSVLSNQLPRTGLLNTIFFYSHLFSYSVKVYLKNDCKEKFYSETRQKALVFQKVLAYITFCKMSNLGV